jgi:glyoxylase-like metal-dependent hydrolase (beta-lactamase superfamily II)
MVPARLGAANFSKGVTMRQAPFKAALRNAAVIACGLIWASPSWAQFEPPTVEAGPKLPAVTAFPAPETYANTTGVSLRVAEPGAEIHYTWDGSKPTAASPKIEGDQVLFIAGVYDGQKGLTTGYTLRAAATKTGRTDSDPVTVSYRIERRDRTAYVSEEVAPGVRMIRDSDNDKMFLVRGTKAYALIDSGMGRGALRDYVAQFTGGLPVIVILTHSHGDHIGQASQFVDSGPVYVGSGDRAAVERFLARQGASTQSLAANLKPVGEGDKIDLGDRALEIHPVAGHTPGSIVIFDPTFGNLFSGDSVGNNSPLPPDVMWMQGAERSLDIYLANVRTLRERLGDKVQRVMTGHNDRPLVGAAYLDNLERALQHALDEGEGALIPSWRPAGIWQVVEGDRFTNPDWFGVNVNRKTFLPAAPDQIAGLTALRLTGARLSQPLDPAIHDYRVTRTSAWGAVTLAVLPTSSRSRRLTVAGKAVAPGAAVKIAAGQTSVPIVVTAPDGRTSATYRLTFENPAR